MENSQTPKSKNSAAWIIAALILVGVVAYGAGQNEPRTTSITTENTAPVSPISPNADINLASRCATDGKPFFDNWLATQAKTAKPSDGAIYDGPEYHYSSKYNTCFVYMTWTVNAFSAAPNGFASYHYDYIYEVYSNKVVLYSGTYRECTQGCTEKILDSFFDVPSLSSQDFYNQKTLLMKS